RRRLVGERRHRPRGGRLEVFGVDVTEREDVLDEQRQQAKPCAASPSRSPPIPVPRVSAAPAEAFPVRLRGWREVAAFLRLARAGGRDQAGPRAPPSPQCVRCALCSASLNSAVIAAEMSPSVVTEK